MKLRELLDVMDSQIRVEIFVTEVDAYGPLTAFPSKAKYIPVSVLRRYGDHNVLRIERPLPLYERDDGRNVEFDGNGTLRIFI